MEEIAPANLEAVAQRGCPRRAGIANSEPELLAKVAVLRKAARAAMDLVPYLEPRGASLQEQKVALLYQLEEALDTGCYSDFFDDLLLEEHRRATE